MKQSFILKPALLLTLSLFAVLEASAQKHGQWTTPFSSTNVIKSDVDGKVIRTFNYHNPDLGRGSLSLSYGFMPVTNMEWWSNPIVPSKISRYYQLPAYYTSCIGTISVAANIYLNPWLELQLPLTYSHGEGALENTASGSFTEDWFSLTPNIKVIWAQNDIFQAYSRIGVGFALVNRTERISNAHAIRANLAFSWQVSPVGIEVGRRVKFFAEGGFGQFGVVSAGVKFHFNSMTYDGANARKQLPEYNWYDVYMTN